MSRHNEEYECDLSGQREAAFDAIDDDDALEDLPPGWTQITFERRVFNPDWVSIQEAKNVQVQQVLQASGMEPGSPQYNAVYTMISIQTDAQFYAMESNTPQFLIEREVRHVAPDMEVLEVYNEIRDQLQMEPLEFEADLASDEDNEGDGEELDEETGGEE